MYKFWVYVCVFLKKERGIGKNFIWYLYYVFKPTSTSPLHLISYGQVFSFLFLFMFYFFFYSAIHTISFFACEQYFLITKLSVNNDGYSNTEDYNYIIYCFPSKDLKVVYKEKIKSAFFLLSQDLKIWQL